MPAKTRVGKPRGNSSELLDGSGMGDRADPSGVVNDAQRVDGIEFGSRNPPDAVVAEILVERVPNALHVAPFDHRLGDVGPANGPPGQFTHSFPCDFHPHRTQFVHVLARRHDSLFAKSRQRSPEPGVAVIYEVAEKVYLGRPILSPQFDSGDERQVGQL